MKQFYNEIEACVTNYPELESNYWFIDMALSTLLKEPNDENFVYANYAINMLFGYKNPIVIAWMLSHYELIVVGKLNTNNLSEVYINNFVESIMSYFIGEMIRHQDNEYLKKSFDKIEKMILITGKNRIN
jgi:hypothetical protein